MITSEGKHELPTVGYFATMHRKLGPNIIEGSLEAKLTTIWKDGNGTARKKLGRGES